MKLKDGVFALIGKSVALVVWASEGDIPTIVYFGARPADAMQLSDIDDLTAREQIAGGPDQEPYPSLSNELGTGSLTAPALILRGSAGIWAAAFRVQRVEEQHGALRVTCRDKHGRVEVCHSFCLLADTNIVTVSTTVTNRSDDAIAIDWCAAAHLPIPASIDQQISFSGRWAGEFQTTRHDIGAKASVMENRRGYSSHDNPPMTILLARDTGEFAGECYGFHLGWSGNSRFALGGEGAAARYFQAGALLFPQEITLKKGERYESPALFAAYSDQGLNDLSQTFHRYYRDVLKSDRQRQKPRPVHYNSWEAIYFDHSEAKILALVDAAAQLGIERFVLDDGWFKGRRDDTSGLGDWTVDQSIYPNGLKPIIDAVTARGMEFGLWVEPEMVNMNSDLYRTHPDWILGPEPQEQIAFRNQFVLDLSRQEVCDYIIGAVDALLCQYDIAYLKWDFNRHINHPIAADSGPVGHRHVSALYGILDTLRAAHPSVEIESCASGGGRADFGILRRSDRIWTSDNNDALERRAIQRGASHFFPPEMLGSHVGPRTCHITGRIIEMGTRAGVALMGHMGVEANILDLDEAEKAELKAAISVYKHYRGLIHSGEFIRLRSGPGSDAVGVVAADGRQALFSYCQITSERHARPGILKFAGLAPDQRYTVKIVWPHAFKTPPPSHFNKMDLCKKGIEAGGDILMKHGLQLPLLFPATCILFELRAL